MEDGALKTLDAALTIGRCVDDGAASRARLATFSKSLTWSADRRECDSSVDGKPVDKLDGVLFFRVVRRSASVRVPHSGYGETGLVQSDLCIAPHRVVGCRSVHEVLLDTNSSSLHASVADQSILLSLDSLTTLQLLQTMVWNEGELSYALDADYSALFLGEHWSTLDAPMATRESVLRELCESHQDDAAIIDMTGPTRDDRAAFLRALELDGLVKLVADGAEIQKWALSDSGKHAVVLRTTVQLKGIAANGRPDIPAKDFSVWEFIRIMWMRGWRLNVRRLRDKPDPWDPTDSDSPKKWFVLPGATSIQREYLACLFTLEAEEVPHFESTGVYIAKLEGRVYVPKSAHRIKMASVAEDDWSIYNRPAKRPRIARGPPNRKKRVVDIVDSSSSSSSDSSSTGPSGEAGSKSGNASDVSGDGFGAFTYIVR
jgi:hypothetical protein